jgi:hypothetical protein
MVLSALPEVLAAAPHIIHNRMANVTRDKRACMAESAAVPVTEPNWGDPQCLN